jgi:histidinol-phosphate phosphatase family protein
MALSGMRLAAHLTDGFEPGEKPMQLEQAGAVFIDKDGTLVEDVPYNVDPAKLDFTPHAVDGLRLLAAHGWRLVIVTNQPGIALGRFDLAALHRLRDALEERLARHGIRLLDFLACPHAAHAATPCECRKPAPGLLQQAAQRHGLDLAASWMVGDILDDVEAGARAGCRTVLLDVGHETMWRHSHWREPTLMAPDLLAAARRIVAARPHRPQRRHAPGREAAASP